jgi:hypothetical protein
MLFINNVLDEVGLPIDNRIPLNTDAQAACKAAHNPEMHELTKHFAVKFHWIRFYVNADTGLIHLI